jgi:hypothetical protein
MTWSNEHRWGSTWRVGQMYVTNRVIDYPDLEWTFQSPGREMEFGDAYVQALSMTRYLEDTLGEDAFWSLIADLETMSFTEALAKHGDMSVREFYEEWVASLWKLALVFSIVSGFGIFQFMAILVIVAYIRKRRQNRRRMREMELDEEDDVPFMTVSQLEDQDPPYPWEEEEYE